MITKESLFSEAHFHYGQKETWRIRGFLQATSATALTPLINALTNAYSIDFQNIGLFISTGVPSAHAMAGVTPLGGVRVLSGPTFPDDGQSSAEYSTYRTYEITVEGRYAFPSTPATTLLRWTEALTFLGGGPRFIHLQPLNGLPQRQQVAESTPYFLTQRGSAAGLYAWPTPPAVLWPAAEHQDQRRLEQMDPIRYGNLAQSNYVEWPIEWEYRMEANVPLTGVPTLWRG